MNSLSFLDHFPTRDLERAFRHSFSFFEPVLHDHHFMKSAESAFPPYNLRRKDNVAVIELAVAGYSKNEIEVTRQGQFLIVEGKKSSEDNENIVWKGIANRTFKKIFNLGEDVKVVAADMLDGMLYICLEKEIAEKDKPQQIKIGSSDSNLKKLIG
jgi:molecular chaperone IbpA